MNFFLNFYIYFYYYFYEKEIKKKILKIKDKYINDTYFWTNPDLNKLNQEIENEFKNLFDINDLNEIKKMIEENQQEINIKGNNNLTKIYTDTTLGTGIVITLSLLLKSYICAFIVPIIITDFIILKNRNDEVKTNLQEIIENLYKKFEEKYILINISLIRKKAEAYNNAIDEFNKFIEEFDSEGEVFI